MSRISQVFSQLKKEGRKAFVPFITAGDPDLQTTGKLLVELARAGAGVIELGVPFSDPMADGPVIQRASERALENEFGLDEIFQLIDQSRRTIDTPIILFSYFNPLLQYGLKQLCQEAKRVGLDGVLVTDLTPEEATDFSAELKSHDLDMIFLIAPTSNDVRLRLVAKHASGFIYAVSRAGVTGARESVSVEAEKLVRRMRAFSDLPIVVGFGISSSSQVAEVEQYADGVVVGSAIVAEIERSKGRDDIVSHIGEFTRSLMPELKYK
ncbi:MAG TPA: tryptophan synthase subunit alpha [Pyrinomonadaceae bacterium]|nr:tryptophan synthase subunit alpha [Pyrinomonadaceae bacterium]